MTNSPISTYRLQLNAEFTFAHAKALVPYLAELGVSHAYLSPILKARPGSTHGYDTVDHQQINPELGTLDDFRDFAKTLSEAGLGIILDFVPNHMGVGGSKNALWLDVLRHGPASKHADWFDIDWTRLDGKLLIPFLGASYAEALAAGAIVLKPHDTGLAIWAHDEHLMPLRPEDEAELLAHYGAADAACAALNGDEGHFGSWAALDAIIGRQHWRLAHFSVAADDINYRRFFINSDLGGLAIDRPDVFDHAHQLIFALIEEGLVDGLRIDHVDGLLDPAGYLKTLRAKSPRPIYLIVEKILAPHEALRTDWGVDGTTGYEFGAMLTRLLTNPDAETILSDTYKHFIGPVTAPADEEYRCKLRVMDNELAAELFALARRVAAVARSLPATADLTENALRKGLREVIAWLTVYRTYLDGTVDPRDAREIDYAIGKARAAQPAFPPTIFDFLARLLTNTLSDEYDPALVLGAIGRFQQYTGPVMAKGLEDTALYRFNRLVSLNEVGAHPDHFSVGIAAFHEANAKRLADEPLTMLTTSTHDTKRGEDTRARIGAIADRPELWATAVTEWRDTLAADGAEAIDPNDLYLLFQLMLGGWPLSGDQPNDLAERLQAAMTKSLREARVHSDWGVPDEGYEDRVSAFITAAFKNTAFFASFKELERALSDIARRKGLIQAALKLTVPGVPDIYRGAEDWEQSFVDPDNRRPVDFAALQLRHAALDPADDKLALTARLLQLRRRLPQLFIAGTYEPIDAGHHLLAFQRRHESGTVLVVADLTPAHIGGDRTMPLPQGTFTDLLTGQSHVTSFANSLGLARDGLAILVAA